MNEDSNLRFVISFWRCARCHAIHVPDGNFDPGCPRCVADKLILSNARASHRRRKIQIVTKKLRS